MWKSTLLRASITALTTLGLMISTPHVQAATQPAQPLKVRVTDAKIFDIALKEQGTLQGRVVDHAGNPAPHAEVVIRQGEQVVAKTVTDRQGRFIAAGLKGGVYEVASGKTVGMYRAWQGNAAPPAAMEQALLVLGQNGERGQFGAMGGGMLLLTTVIIASLVVGIVSLDKINDIEDDLNAQSP
jgi:hypothetical protein